MKKKPTTIAEKPKTKKIQARRNIETSSGERTNSTDDRTNRTVTEDGIRERAYHIWKDLGEPHGQETNHWVRAELELSSRI